MLESGRILLASWPTIHGSLRSSSEAGGNFPVGIYVRRPWNFSTVTNWATERCRSSSVLPKHGRINASLPVTK